ncbi:DUF1149 family protein, partial [Streptococcus agalactiae]
RLINEPSEFSQDEVENLAAPLLEIVKRLTYEVTEKGLAALSNNQEVIDRHPKKKF